VIETFAGIQVEGILTLSIKTFATEVNLLNTLAFFLRWPKIEHHTAGKIKKGRLRLNYRGYCEIPNTSLSLSN